MTEPNPPTQAAYDAAEATAMRWHASTEDPVTEQDWRDAAREITDAVLDAATPEPESTRIKMTLELDLSDHDITELARSAGVVLFAARAVVAALIARRRFVVDDVRRENARLLAELEAFRG